MKAFKQLLVSFLVASSFSCNSIEKLYVNHSRFKNTVPADNEVVRIFFDNYGDIYPDTLLDDAEMRPLHTRLEPYLKANPVLYQNLLKKYGLSIVEPPEEGFTIEPLQKALLAKYATEINRKTVDKKLVFIVHGFNEHPMLPLGNSSYDENRITREKIQEKFPAVRFLFVEVYWDGLSKELGNKNRITKNLNSLKIWNNAQPSASNAGLELRRLLSKLNKDKIYMLSHSHGAGLITHALFNVQKYQNGELQQSLNQKYRNLEYNSPTQEFFIGMLAPAIPGMNVFDEYFIRTQNGKEITSSQTNYHFIVGFNRFDPITNKFGIAARKLGSTTLGSTLKELEETRHMLKFNNNILDYEDFSLNSECKRQRDHSWLVYMENTKHFNKFLTMTFKGLQ